MSPTKRRCEWTAGLAMLLAACGGAPEPGGNGGGVQRADGGADAGRSCADDPTGCVDGACAPCAEGRTACEGRCIVTEWDEANCGGCRRICQGVCSGGECLCPDGVTACKGACVDTATDPANCGACDVACAADRACVGGECVACPEGETACDGACVNTAFDRSNCGACGRVCEFGSWCFAGECRVPCGVGLCREGEVCCLGGCCDGVCRWGGCVHG